MSRIFDIADRYIDKVAALQPLVATYLGIPGHETEMPDNSPAGDAAQAELDRSSLAELARAEPENDNDRMAREVMVEDLETTLESYDAGEQYRTMNILHSPFQTARQIFDLMARESKEDWDNIAARMSRVPETLASYRETLEEGVGRGQTTSRRQVIGVIEQAKVYSGQGEGPSFFDGLVSAYDETRLSDGALRERLENAARDASEAFANFGIFLADEHINSTPDRDGVGLDRYELRARSYLGAQVDFEETYAWGWEQVRWAESEMAATADKIVPGGNFDDAKKLLDEDPERSIEGVDAFKEWMQDLQDQTIRDLDGTHFDIADPVKTVEVMIAPPGGALAMYYTGPSEDFSRPGQTWYPVPEGKTRFPLWGEVSIVYHEGVPGHHFQIATANCLGDQLSRFQKLAAGTSGYMEGWGLYAERLMGELGYLDNPDYYLGMLGSQLFRSQRVVVDIGMHLGLRIPNDSNFHPGEVWTPDLALEFMQPTSPFGPEFMVSEIDRYLGMPGQAISYKVGERYWLDAREQAISKAGPGFDLKAWHNRALNLGPMGLAQMQRELTGA
ncbi:MAG: DUF885 domain-containing protein [Dehalococcoidia bacterium]|nr:DUF885 domain-containing protein [Dehalococcoidia bacterium]